MAKVDRRPPGFAFRCRGCTVLIRSIHYDITKGHSFSIMHHACVYVYHCIGNSNRFGGGRRGKKLCVCLPNNSAAIKRENLENLVWSKSLLFFISYQRYLYISKKGLARLGSPAIICNVGHSEVFTFKSFAKAYLESTTMIHVLYIMYLHRHQ